MRFTRSRIYERTQFLVSRHYLESSQTWDFRIYNVYIKNQFQTTFVMVGGGLNPLVELIVNGKEENS